jgi:hypothetical protein
MEPGNSVKLRARLSYAPFARCAGTGEWGAHRRVGIGRGCRMTALDGMMIRPARFSA